jgi:hypothetical protein
MKCYCIRVGDQYLSGQSSGLGCVPKLVKNKNFAYVYDSPGEAQAAVNQLKVAQITWDPRIEEM